MAFQEETNKSKSEKITDKNISNAITEEKIKSAISAPIDNIPVPSAEEKVIGPEYSGAPGANENYSIYKPGVVVNNQSEMGPSGMEQMPELPPLPELMQQQNYPAQQEYPEQYAPTMGEYDYPTGLYDASSYQQYQPYGETMASDMINEITEQIVNEKFAQMQNKLEKAIDFRTIAEAKISNLSERLKRIEKIIDSLQLSLLQKVGEYVNDVSDLKKELIETQKSFKFLMEKKQPKIAHKKSHEKRPKHSGHKTK